MPTDDDLATATATADYALATAIMKLLAGQRGNTAMMALGYCVSNLTWQSAESQAAAGDRLDSFAEFVANLLDDIYNGNVKFAPIGASVH
jgi:hypothetical protein